MVVNTQRPCQLITCIDLHLLRGQSFLLPSQNQSPRRKVRAMRRKRTRRKRKQCWKGRRQSRRYNVLYKGSSPLLIRRVGLFPGLRERLVRHTEMVASLAQYSCLHIIIKQSICWILGFNVFDAYHHSCCSLRPYIGWIPYYNVLYQSLVSTVVPIRLGRGFNIFFSLLLSPDLVNSVWVESVA